MHAEEIFKNELGSFEAPVSGYRDFTLSILNRLPAYFLTPGRDGGDNSVVSHTKASVAFANTLLGLEAYRSMFGASERDIIRSALLLHDGMIYGTAENPGQINPSHPDLMAEFIELDTEAALPPFMRGEVVSAVRKHSGNRSINGAGVPNGSEIDRFVHMCVYLATKKETTVLLPGVADYYKRNLGMQAMNVDTAISIVRQMTDGCYWDGQVYSDNNSTFVVLNNSKVYVAAELREAFLIVGQARCASTQNHEYLQRGTLAWDAFVALYPDWNHMVYGSAGALYIQSKGQNVGISDEQARALGVVIP